MTTRYKANGVKTLAVCATPEIKKPISPRLIIAKPTRSTSFSLCEIVGVSSRRSVSPSVVRGWMFVGVTFEVIADALSGGRDISLGGGSCSLATVGAETEDVTGDC